MGTAAGAVDSPPRATPSLFWHTYGSPASTSTFPLSPLHRMHALAILAAVAEPRLCHIARCLCHRSFKAGQALCGAYDITTIPPVPLVRRVGSYSPDPDKIVLQPPLPSMRRSPPATPGCSHRPSSKRLGPLVQASPTTPENASSGLFPASPEPLHRAFGHRTVPRWCPPTWHGLGPTWVTTTRPPVPGRPW